MLMREYFRDKIKEDGISYAALAERMGTNPSYLSAMLNGRRGIGEKSFSGLCTALALEEHTLRALYGDQIAQNLGTITMHGGKREGSVKKKSAKKPAGNGYRLTARESSDAAELLISMMHLFVVDLNDDGKRVVMSVMKILSGIEAFTRKKEPEGNDENKDHEIQD